MNLVSGKSWTAVLLCCAVFSWPVTYAQQPPPPESGTAVASKIVATVDDRPIYADDVERELRATLGERQVEAAMRSRLEAAALEKLIERQLVLSFLQQKNIAASNEDVDLVVQRLEQQLKARSKTLNDFLKEQQLSAERLRANYLWSLSWRRFLDRYLTDANLQEYFMKHAADFDGTRVQVAHILWKAETVEDVEKGLKTARSVREDILAKRITFADAARKYSQAPTAEKGGDIGWIERHQPMPKKFSDAAYALKVGEISEPIMTSFGVHLIQCLKIEPGKIQWHEVRSDLELAVENYLFHWAAEKQRAVGRVFNPSEKEKK